MSEWISVNDRLPIEKDDLTGYWNTVDVIACKGQHVFCCRFDAGNTCGFWHKFNDDGAEHITHWMPLPSPPTGDNT